jgi:hypothetical protein
VDILVNYAAIFPMGPTPEIGEEDIDAASAVNVKPSHRAKARRGAAIPSRRKEREGIAVHVVASQGNGPGSEARPGGAANSIVGASCDLLYVDVKAKPTGGFRPAVTPTRRGEVGTRKPTLEKQKSSLSLDFEKTNANTV